MQQPAFQPAPAFNTSAQQPVNPNTYGNTQQPLFNQQPQQPYASNFGNPAPVQPAPVADPNAGQPAPSATDKDERGIPAFLRRKK